MHITNGKSYYTFMLHIIKCWFKYIV